MCIKIQSNINTPVFPFHSPFPSFFIVNINSWCIIVHSTIENTKNARYNTLKNTFLQKIYNWSGVKGNFDFRQIFPKIEKHASTILFIYCRWVPQAYPTLSDPMDCSTPGFPVLHYLLEFTQTYVHWVSDAIQPSHPLSPPSPPAFNLSQHQGLFSESVLCIRWPQYWSFSFKIMIYTQENSILIISVFSLKYPSDCIYPQKAWHLSLNYRVLFLLAPPHQLSL